LSLHLACRYCNSPTGRLLTREPKSLGEYLLNGKVGILCNSCHNLEEQYGGISGQISATNSYTIPFIITQEREAQITQEKREALKSIVQAGRERIARLTLSV
jgi:hypothetical protein